jgi:hypothetical protein
MNEWLGDNNGMQKEKKHTHTVPHYKEERVISLSARFYQHKRQVAIATNNLFLINNNYITKF